MIAWTPDLSLDIEEIDGQHKKFIEIMAELDPAVNAGLGQEVVGAILVKLVGYANFHFGTEEKYFVQFNYEESEEHREMHQQFFMKVNELRQRHVGGEDVALETMNFMFNWLVGHIRTVDRKYVDCFHKHGLK